MKKLMVLCVTTILCHLASAQEISIVTEDNPPFSYIEDGRITGFTAEIARELVGATGVKVRQFELYPWSRAYKMALEQENVLIFPLTRRQEREPNFKWIGPVADNTKYFYRLKSRHDIQIASIQQAKQFIIGAVRLGSIAQLLEGEGFVVGRNLDLVTNKRLNTKRLLAGKVDLITNTNFGMQNQLVMLGLAPDMLEKAFQFPSSGDYYLAFSQKTPDQVVNRFQLAFERLKQSGKYQQLSEHFLHSMSLEPIESDMANSDR